MKYWQIKRAVKKKFYRLIRNEYDLNGTKAKRKTVNLEYYRLLNVGDSLSPIVVNWMLNQKNIDPLKKVKKTKHLMAIGSIISFGNFDSTIWGSGLLKVTTWQKLKKQHEYRKLDIRSVRGPLTREVLVKSGYIDCPETYGDPAILMPNIYTPSTEKKYEISLILHHRIKNYNNEVELFGADYKNDMIGTHNIHYIDPKTIDYKFFIDEINASKLVISSSLHGIILSEAYNVPAIFLNYRIDDQIDKFTDWYRSTKRELNYINSISDVFRKDIPAIPDLDSMKEDLLNSFPYDLWEIS